MKAPTAPLPNLSRWATLDAGPFRFGARARSVAPAATDGPLPFGQWMALARPEHRWDARHFRVMQAALDGATALAHRRVLFQVPIRHGKTEHNTIGYAVHRLEHDPRFRWLVGSYNQRQADKLSREIRRLAKARGVTLSPDRDAASEWETAAGGGVRAVGAGAGVASVNADGILLDDPIGSRDEAESAAHRDRVWDWLTNDILARAEPHTILLLSMSRWHRDDPVGRILEQHPDRWHVVDLPAEAEPDDPLGRAPGEPLWPELRGAAWLAEKRAELGAYGFASLLQQRPRPRDGGMFKWEWFPKVGAAPAPGEARRVRYWDTAGTEGGGDYTAGALLARRHDGLWFVEDVVRGQWSPARRDAQIRATAERDAATYGRTGVHIWLEREGGVAGRERSDATTRLLAGFVVHTEPATGSKTDRADPFASQAEVGNVRLVEGAWNAAFLDEACDFPHGKHDDQVDAASGAFNKIAAMIGQQATVSSFSLTR